jgi:hypothetical protein
MRTRYIFLRDTYIQSQVQREDQHKAVSFTLDAHTKRDQMCFFELPDHDYPKTP